MGRLLLIALLAVVLGACASQDTATDPHADLSCAACHSGSQGERGRATVPATSCAGSGCHEAGGPSEVQVATVTFPHRDHAEGHEIEATCAGCHTHDSGTEPLRASVEACALCHVSDVTSADAQECRLCHEEPDHSSLTSQGVAVSHSQLPWIEIGCVRCHYDVAGAETEVSGLQCRECHEDLSVLNQRAVGRDLHPIHAGVTCTACHQEGLHEVKAMSSAVELVCADCHQRAHEVDVELAEWPTSTVCAECHVGVHAPQQRLLLGIRPGGGAMPSTKFVAGMTCRSCHVPPQVSGAAPEAPIRGQAAACAGCHQQEYTQVLDWWVEGSKSRLESSTAYVTRAEAAVGAHSDSTRALLDGAREMVGLVAAAGGQHNLELSDRLMRDAVDRATAAYRLAGRRAPTPPDMGRVPHMGMCSYCHYGADEPWNFRAMEDDFHRSVLTPRP
jgi:hypothetical protein